MRDLISTYGAWVLSITALYITWLTGSKASKAWAYALAGQVLWFAWIWASRSWGLLPLAIGLTALYNHNHRKWNARGDAELDDLRMGWIVADAAGTRFRRWGDSGPEWTTDPDKALHFSRRFPDAEEFCAEDEDAWRIIRHAFPLSIVEIEHRRVV